MPIYKRHRSKKNKLDYQYKLNKESDMLDIKRFPNKNIGTLLEFLRPEHTFTSEQNAMRFCRRMVKDLGELICNDIILNGSAYAFPAWEFGHVAIFNETRKTGAEMNWDSNGANYVPKVQLSSEVKYYNKKNYSLKFDKRAKLLFENHLKEGNQYAH
jgi:hypothetical protein